MGKPRIETCWVISAAQYSTCSTARRLVLVLLVWWLGSGLDKRCSVLLHVIPNFGGGVLGALSGCQSSPKNDFWAGDGWTITSLHVR